MHVTSVLNTNNKSIASLPVSVFDYAGRRKLVVKSNNYEETVGYVKKAFKIANEAEVVLSTASLDVCRGQQVEIDEQAYPHMWDVLDEIIVGTPGNDASRALTPATTPPLVTQSKGKKRASMASNRTSIPTARPSRVHQVNIGPSTASAPPAKPVKVEPTIVLDFYPENHVQPGEPDLEVLPEPEPEPEPAPAPTGEVKTGPSIDSLFDDEEVENYVTKPEPQEEDELPSSPSPVTKKSRSVIQRDPTPEPVVKTEKPAETKKSKFKPAAPAPSSSTGTSASTVLPPSSAPSSTATATVTNTKQPRTKAAAAPKETAVDENARFSIVIHGPEDISAQFKMRGKHPIHKILKTACANFGLPFERATLYLVKGEDGEEPDFQELEKDKTALQCGITEGARLYIGVDGESEGQEEDYYDEEED